MAKIILETPDSSNVSKVQFDPKQKEVEVTFKNGNTYRYHNVPQEVWTNFTESLEQNGSAGRSVREYFINGGYKYERV